MMLISVWNCGQPGGTDNGCVGGGVTCSAPQMAENDIFLWEAQADDTLPNGDVIVAVDNTVVPPIYTISVTWDEPGQQQNYSVAIPVPGF